MVLMEKQRALEQYLRDLGSVVIAFSGGVDSTYLLKMAQVVLGEGVLAVTARSLSFPQRELDEAVHFTSEHGIPHVIVDSEELDIDGFSQNPVNRCYLCKSELFCKIKPVAQQRGFIHIAEGSNADDMGDYRPGLQAVAEAGVHSPLRAAGLTKEDIRHLSKELELSTWNKQSFACLSSRFPYGEKITPKLLEMVGAAEQHLLDLGFHQVRVRCHGNVARLELDAQGFHRMMDANLRRQVHCRFKEIGFDYVALDLLGYRTGSMNETLEAG